MPQPLFNNCTPNYPTLYNTKKNWKKSSEDQKNPRIFHRPKEARNRQFISLNRNIRRRSTENFSQIMRAIGNVGTVTNQVMYIRNARTHTTPFESQQTGPNFPRTKRVRNGLNKECHQRSKSYLKWLTD